MFGTLKLGLIDLQSAPQFEDPVFAKASPKRSFSMTETERFGLVIAKNVSINSGTGLKYLRVMTDAEAARVSTAFHLQGEGSSHQRNGTTVLVK